MKLIIKFVTFSVMLKFINTHYDYGDYYRRSPDDGYENIPQADYLNNPEMYPVVSNNFNYAPEECICSCDICYSETKECCMQYCTTCTEDKQGLVYYPYPYYVLNSPSPPITKPTEAQIKLETTTQRTQATQTTTETEERVEQTRISSMDNEPLTEDAIQDRYIKELLENGRSKNEDNVMLTSLRRTKPRWMPKFGIVPIPDQLAENLMLKIRNMKVLHPEKDTVRRIESIYPRSE